MPWPGIKPATLSYQDDALTNLVSHPGLSYWIYYSTLLSLWSFQSPVAHSYSLLNHLNSFHRGMFKLNAKFDADSLLCSLSHFECDGHTVHMLTQWHLLPPLTSTVKLSVFTHVHSSPLSLAARLHQCHANHSRYINNGWTFSRQTLYLMTC